MTKLRKRLYQGGVAAAVLTVAMVPLSASANPVNTTINATVGSTLSMSAGGAVNLSLEPGGQPVVSSGSDVVTVSTNNTGGYSLTLANADANTSLVSGSNTITAHTGSHSSPSALASNTWGYAVPGEGDFGASYTAETNNSASTSVWAGVPASGAPVTLKNRAGTATNDTTTVWYGVKVDSSQPTGTYTDTVTYTATVN